MLQIGDDVLIVQLGKRELKFCPILVDSYVGVDAVSYLPSEEIKAIADDVERLNGHDDF